MIWFAMILLVAWPLVVLYIFERQPIRPAIVTSFIGAWLFLPPLIIPLSGIPDWTKATATSVGVLTALLLKQPGRLLAFRPRWFDLPVLCFCGCSLPSALAMGVGAYEGCSSVLEESVRWGLPYLIGRIYLANSAGARQLTTGIAVGGLIYIPLCMLEIRLSPILKMRVYGMTNLNVAEFGFRYGGYRPAVFLTSGLEVGWWMCCATLCAYLLIASRTTRRWFNLPATPLAWSLAGVTVACKSTGALVQVSMGFILIGLARLIKRPLPLALLLVIPPVYCVSRSSGYCSGQQISSVLSNVFDASRIQSLSYRFEMEDYLIRAALQHPILGWTRNGGFNPVDAEGKAAAVPDGYWIIVFCCTGAVGLILLNLMLLLPSFLFFRRYPIRTWLTPEVAPLLALATILPLFMIDNLSNAMLNPIYAIAMGLVSGCVPSRLGAAEAQSAAEDTDGGEASFVRAIAQQAHLVRRRPHPRNVEHLASLRAQHARWLTAQGRDELARSERAAAEDLWGSLARTHAGGSGHAAERAANANDLAWLLASTPEVEADRLAWAHRLAEVALAIDPRQAAFWNTMGIVCCRLGDYHRAIQALSRSVTLNPNGGTAFDFFYLALANRALGYEPMALTWFDRGEAWLSNHPELGEALATIRADLTGPRT